MHLQEPAISPYPKQRDSNPHPATLRPCSLKSQRKFCAPLIFPVHATLPTHLILFQFGCLNNIWWRVQII
jgi:hypothetical protein